MVSILPTLSSLTERERKQEIDLGDNSPLVRKSKAVLDSGFHTVDSGFKVLDFIFQWKLDSGFQSLVGFFRIPNPRIPDSTSNNFPYKVRDNELNAVY